MSAYYNEREPFAAQWLRNLIAAGHVAPGDVDERSIEDVQPDDLDGYTQCHFFAGIGVWSHALRAAGWSDSRAVWTGSCPCQPFSAAGEGRGFDDERHLWPAFGWLITQRRPPIILGEQVASKDSEPWIDLVQSDLEALGYAFGCVPFPAAGGGAPHLRDRAYWMAHAEREGLQGFGSQRELGGRGCEIEIGRHGHLRQLADSSGGGRGQEREDSGRVLAGDWPERFASRLEPGFRSGSGLPVADFWGNADWLACRDGKWRPVEPGSFPLADGATARVGRLRAYGNALVSPAARVFIEAAMECLP